MRWCAGTPSTRRRRSRCATAIRRLTYRQLLAAADALAADLARHGVRAGQRVGVWLPSRIESVVALLACSQKRRDLLPVAAPRPHRRRGRRADAAHARRRLHLAERLWRRRRQARPDRGAARRCRRCGTSIGSTPLAESDQAPFAGLAPGSGSRRAVKTDPNQIVYLAFTSGTTGKPKGVMHSDNTLLANARQLAKDWSIGNTLGGLYAVARSATISASARR